VLARAAQAGVGRIVVTGTSFCESRRAIELALAHPGMLLATVGVHPHDAKRHKQAHMVDLEAMITRNENVVVAVGETGLDYNRDYSPRDVQIRVFEAQVDLACRLKKPLFLHEREAHEDFVRVLDARPSLPPVVVHCFTGTRAELAAYIRRGFYIGVTGFIAMERRGRDLRACLALEVPLARLMVETDAPFMTPDGAILIQDRRNEPFTLPAVVETVARCYGIDAPTVARVTAENSRRFFGLAS